MGVDGRCYVFPFLLVELDHFAKCAKMSAFDRFRTGGPTGDLHQMNLGL
jgi:hypothetical protein